MMWLNLEADAVLVLDSMQIYFCMCQIENDVLHCEPNGAGYDDV